MPDSPEVGEPVQIVEGHPEAADCVGVVRRIDAAGRLVVAVAVPGFYGSRAVDFACSPSEVRPLAAPGLRRPSGS